MLEGATTLVDLVVPYDRGDVVARLHEMGDVVGEDHVAAGTRLRVKLPKLDADRFVDYQAHLRRRDNRRRRHRRRGLIHTAR